jgi:hypothetical protein
MIWAFLSATYPSYTSLEIVATIAQAFVEAASAKAGL